MAKVLYSPGFGAGWSSWNMEIPREFMCMDPTLIEMAEAGATEEDVEKYILTKYEGVYTAYTGGWRGIQVAELPTATLFRIKEYDGSESIVVFDLKEYMVAI